MSGQRESNPLLKFRHVTQFRHKYAVGCALDGKVQIDQFARIAHGYALPVSEFVRKRFGNAKQRFVGLVPQTLFGTSRARIASDESAAILLHLHDIRRNRITTDDKRVAMQRLPDVTNS